MSGFKRPMTEGFYTKKEAARLLGVSTRQINNYFNEGKLTRVIRGRKAWIPREEVQRLYDADRYAPMLGQEDLLKTMQRVEELERQVETLKLGLGYGSKKPLRQRDQLLVIRQRLVDALSKEVWSKKMMSSVADLLMTLQTAEIVELAEDMGPTAWLPLTDLSNRMLQYIEDHEDYPGGGLDVLETRLIRARDRFYGMVYSTTKLDMGTDKTEAMKVYKTLQMPPNAIEMHIVGYLTS